MKKNVLLKYSTLLLAGSMVLPIGMSAYADETPSQNANSNANIILDVTEEVEPGPIIPDPDNKDEDGQDEGQTGNTHPLRIDRVSNLNFGEIQLTSRRQSISLRAQRPAAAPNVQVSDFRSTGAGWTLQVSTTGFLYENENRDLRGATLTFKGTDENLQPVGENPFDPPTTQEVILTAGSGPTPMMIAQRNAGMGSWSYGFEDVVIDIPAGSLSGNYTATLVWVLSDAPHGTN